MRKPIKLNETIDQNDVDFVLGNLNKIIDTMKIVDKTQIELTAACRGRANADYKLVRVFVKMKDGTFRAAEIPQCQTVARTVYGLWAKKPDYAWSQNEIRNVVDHDRIDDVTIIGDREIDENIVKTVTDKIKTRTKELADYAGDVVKSMGKDVHDTFLTSKNIKMFLTAVQKAKKDSPETYMNATISVKAMGKEYFVKEAVTGGKMKALGRTIIFKCEEGKAKSKKQNDNWDITGATLDQIGAVLKKSNGAGDNFKVKSDFDSIRISIDNANIQSGEKLTFTKIKLDDKSELKIYRGDIKSVQFSKSENIFIMEMEKTTQEKHKEAADDIWSL